MMTRSAAFKLIRGATRQLSTPSLTIARSSLTRQPRPSLLSRVFYLSSVHTYRSFSTTPAASKGLSPESEDPAPKEPESHIKAAQPAELTEQEYHELANMYIDSLVQRMEQLQEESDEVDVEYSVHTLPISSFYNGAYYSMWTYLIMT